MTMSIELDAAAMAIVDVLSFDLVFGFVLGTMFGFSVNFTLRAIIQTANAGTGRGRSRMFRVAAILLRGFATFCASACPVHGVHQHGLQEYWVLRLL